MVRVLVANQSPITLPQSWAHAPVGNALIAWRRNGIIRGTDHHSGWRWCALFTTGDTSMDFQLAADSRHFSLGDYPVIKGGVIRNARVVYKTYGTLSAARDNVVLYPCS